MRHEPGFSIDIKTLSKISQEITSSIDLSKITNILYKNLNRLMDASTLSIGIIDQEKKEVSFMGFRGRKKPFSNELLSLSNKTRLSIYTIKKQETIFSNNIQKDLKQFLKTPDKKYFTNNAEKSIIYLPIKYEKKIVGVLLLKGKERGLFNENHVDILQYLTAYIAIAIENAKAYQILREQSKKIKELDQIKASFFTNLSHEFRTPLTLLLGPLEDLIYSGDNISDNKKEKLLLLAKSNGDKLLKLINQLLEFSSLESGVIALNTSYIDIVALAKKIKDDFTFQSQKEKINIHLNTSHKTIFGFVDGLKFESILNNLLSNALKFTPTNGSITISIKQDNTKKNISLLVNDTGIGIPKENLDKIFSRYFSPIHKNNPTGVGIGLSLVKSLVDIHKGSIKVESKENSGTTFQIDLPINKESYNLPRKKSVRKIDKKAKAQTKLDFIKNKNAQKILIVEDNVDLLVYLQEGMSAYYNVITAKNGKEGYKKALKFFPDLIISDIMMGKMNGLDLCEKIKKNTVLSHIPVILLTAKASTNDQIEGLKIGADDYIYKPFDNKLLNAKVKTILDNRKKLIYKFWNKSKLHFNDLASNNTDAQFLEQTEKIVMDNLLNDSFSVTTLIKELGISRTQLFRKLKYLTNKSAQAFITSIQLKKASEILATNINIPIGEVAYTCGFKDPSHFTKVFKKQFGILPTDYKLKK